MAFPFFQLLFNSLIIGSIYALVACGFSLIYATNRFVHFAHGASVTAAAYFAYWVAQMLGAPFWLAILCTLVFAALFGGALYQFMYLPLQNKNSSNVILLIASVAILIFIENMVLLLFGADVKSFGFSTETVRVLNASVTVLQCAIIVIVAALLVLLYLFMKRTKLGRRMRAVADNKDLANIMGVNSKRIALYSFLIGSLLAGIAGILIGLEQNLEPTMGTHLMIKGFTGAIIGGVTSVPASILGSYLLGIAENFGIWWLPSGYKDAIAFGLLFIFLIFRPTGILGINKGVRK